MKIERIKEIRRPDLTVLAVDKWDVNAFEDQLEEVPELGNLMENGLQKLPTFYGLLLDLFSVLFAGNPKRRARVNPLLMINAMVIGTIWAMPELQRLRIHCQSRRHEVTACILRFAKAILDALPPEMLQQMQAMLKEAGGLGDAEEPGEEEDDGSGDGGMGSGDGAGEQEGSGSEADGSGAGDGQGGAGEGQGSSPGQGRQPGGRPGKGGGRGSPRPTQVAPAGVSRDGEGSRGSAEQSAAAEALAEAVRRVRPRLTQALRGELQNATVEMQDLRDICSSQGWDLSKPNLSREDSSAAWDACKKLLKNQFLREVFRLFGNRFRTMAIAAQEQKPVGRGFSAIERTIGEEIDAVPSDELSGFAHPALRILALQDVAEGTLIQDAYREIYQRQEGDIIALMDDSGSTAGKIAHFIKGAVLGLQAIAQSQGRRMVVIPFTSVAHAKIDLTEGKPQDLLRLAELRADGGTDFEVALRAGIAAVKDGFNPDQAPDIVMFTDGACPIPCYAYNTALEKVAEVKARVMAELKRELEALGARLKVVYVGVRKPTPYPDIGELAGPGNEIFLESILEAEKLTKVYEQI